MKILPTIEKNSHAARSSLFSVLAAGRCCCCYVVDIALVKHCRFFSVWAILGTRFAPFSVLVSPFSVLGTTNMESVVNNCVEISATKLYRTVKNIGKKLRGKKTKTLKLEERRSDEKNVQLTAYRPTKTPRKVARKPSSRRSKVENEDQVVPRYTVERLSLIHI